MHRYDRSRRRLAVGLAALAGFVDAIGFLEAGGYFVSFMSGNSTRLAVDLVTRPAAAIVPAALIAGFLFGVTIGAAFAARAGANRKFAVLAGVTLLLLIAAVAQGFGELRLALGAMVAAMGMLNNTFQRDGEVSIGLTYMTGALVRLGQSLGNRFAGGGSDGAGSWLLLWLGLTSGAVAGAISHARFGGTAIWVAAGAAAAATILARRLRNIALD